MIARLRLQSEPPFSVSPQAPPWPLLLALLTLLCPTPPRADEARAVSRRIDSILEQPQAWQNGRGEPGTVELSTLAAHGKGPSLLMTWPKGLGKMKGEGRMEAPQLSARWLKLPAGLDLSQFESLSLWARMAGPRHGHLQLKLTSRKVLWAKGLISTSTNLPLDAGAWSQYSFHFTDLSPAEREQLKWLAVLSTNVGTQPGEPAWLKTWLDDFVLHGPAGRPHVGWAADPTVVIVNQLGFRPFHEKTAVVGGQWAGTAFHVREAGGDHDVVFRGSLDSIKGALGTHAAADFTLLTREGRYVVEAAGVTSLPFRIAPDALAPGLTALSDWVFDMRCGMATRLHPACHLDDGSHAGRGGIRRALDVSGGWHDAGGVRTYYLYSYLMARSALRTRELGWRQDRDGDGTDDMLDTARWALSHALKLRDPDNGQLLGRIDDRPDHRTGNYWTDGRRGNADDRRVRIEDESGAHVANLAASAGLFARLEGRSNPLAASALALAEERWQVWFHARDGYIPWQRKLLHEKGHGHIVARWGQGALQLYLATGKPRYLDFARLAARRIMSYQGVGLPGGESTLSGNIFRWQAAVPDRDLPEQYLADLMLELPGDPDAPRWRAALVRFTQHWSKPIRRAWLPYGASEIQGASSVFPNEVVGLPLAFDAQGKTTQRVLPAQGPDAMPDTAFALMRVAAALKDTELERLVRRQVYWALGHNPFNISWVAGLGSDSIDQNYSFAQGRMPGSVASFGMAGKSGRPSVRRGAGAEPLTRVGAKLLRALASVTQPARFRLSVTRDGRPFEGALNIRWSRSDEKVLTTRTDALGRVPDFELDGGEDYVVEVAGRRLPLRAISGTMTERTLNLDRVLLLRAELPAVVSSFQAFELHVILENPGFSDVEEELLLHVWGANPRTLKKAVSVAAGETHAFNLPLRAGIFDRPLIVLLSLAGQPGQEIDLVSQVRRQTR